MAKSFTKLYSDFWINPDNADLMQLGTDAKLMAIYLQGNAHQNILGVYYLPTLYVANDLKQSVRKVQNALKELCNISYCRYDEHTQYIWVCNIALEQLGEDIDAKDNRIKAVQAIWDSLPRKIEFLSEVYNKYNTVFNLKSRSFRLSHQSCSSRYDSPEIESIEIVETKRNIEAPLDTNNYVNLNLDKKSGRYEKDSITNLHKSISPDIDLSSGLTSHFEGVAAKKSLQSPSMLGNGCGYVYDYDFDKTNLPITLLSLPKKEEIQEGYLHATACSNGYTDSNTQSLADYSDKVDNTNGVVVPYPSKGATHFFNFFGDPSKNISASFNTPSKELAYPLQAPLKGLQSPSEAPSKGLRSNIEDRSKNTEEEIEKRNKKKKEEVEKIKDLYKNNVPIPNIVAFKQQTRPCTNKKPVDKNSLFFKKTKNEKKEKAKSRIDDSVAEVFEHWKSVMQHPKSKLDQKRKVLIRKALQIGYSTQELCDAITGCSLTPHNTGDNEQGERYDGLHIILRNADQIDRFVRNFHHPPQKENKAQKRLRENFCMAKEWAERKTGNTIGSK